MIVIGTNFLILKRSRLKLKKSKKKKKFKKKDSGNSVKTYHNGKPHQCDRNKKWKKNTLGQSELKCLKCLKYLLCLLMPLIVFGLEKTKDGKWR